MAGNVLYLCESAGARIIAYGTGTTQIGAAYQASVQTWESLPTGESGKSLFRSINAIIKVVGAWSIGLTPTVDGVDYPEQQFSGAGSGQQVCEALVGIAGIRIAATLRTILRSGDLEIQNLTFTTVPIRRFP